MAGLHGLTGKPVHGLLVATFDFGDFVRVGGEDLLDDGLQGSGVADLLKTLRLDDFGSGFSTFGYLKYLGVEILKIDGLFIRDLPNNRDNQVFVKAMAEVARGLGKIAVAEFVEDAATLDMVKSLGIELAQGYYFGCPKAEIPGKS